MYYDKHGTVMAAGAEADDVSIISQAEDEDWIKTELYVSTPVYLSITKYLWPPVSSFDCVQRR